VSLRGHTWHVIVSTARTQVQSQALTYGMQGLVLSTFCSHSLPLSRAFSHGTEVYCILCYEEARAMPWTFSLPCSVELWH